jgi:hypothetical protein
MDSLGKIPIPIYMINQSKSLSLLDKLVNLKY